MTHNSPDVTQRAQAGEAAAIASLLNHSLRADNVTAEVERQGDQLAIRLWGNTPPSPALAQRVHQGLARLQPAAIATVMIYGFTANQFLPDWEETVHLTPPAPSAPPQPPPAPAATTPANPSPPPSPTHSPRPKAQASRSGLALITVVIGAQVLAWITALIAATRVYQAVMQTTSGNWGSAAEWAGLYAVPTFFIVLFGSFLAYLGLGGVLIAILRPLWRRYRSQHR